MPQILWQIFGGKICSRMTFFFLVVMGVDLFEWPSCAIGAVNNITTSLFVSIYRAKWGGGGGGRGKR